MKKSLSVLLAIVLLLCAGLLPAYAINDNKDDSRLEADNFFGDYHNVTFVEGESESTQSFEEGADIVYPTLTASRTYDYVWSLSESEYSPVHKVMPENDFIVYAIKIPYVGFENYPDVTDSAALKVSSDYFYSGEKSLKLNFQSSSENGEREHSITLGNITAATAYKISFKYYIPSVLNADYYIDPYTGYSDILTEGNGTEGMRVDYSDSRFTVQKDSAIGEWLDGEIYFTADELAINNYNYLYLWLKAGEYNSTDTIYFDNITTEAMVTADFVINSNVILNSTNGILKDNVFTAYYSADAAITAPNVVTSDGGTPVIWNDANGNIAKEFTAGGVYSIKLDYKGDLNTNGAVNTVDLALIKQYLVELIGDDDINIENADINTSGKVNIVDMAYLKLYLAGVIEELQ